MRNESDNRPCRRHRVVVVATPRTRVFELGIACEVFGTDRRDLTPDWYDFELVATDDPTRLSNGLVCPPGRGLAALRDADTVVVPACTDVDDALPAGLPEAVAEAHRAGTRIAAICSGAFVVAAAGLLDGHRATTHWMHADEFARRHPQIEVDPSAIYVESAGIWTSAGSAAGLDLCLELVRTDHGAAVANEVARRVVVPPHRSGNQAQYVRRRPTARASWPTEESALHQWTRENLAHVTVRGMAERAGVSERTLIRRFHDTTGTSPQIWLQHERLTAAQELLETTDLPLHTVARLTGLGSPTNLRARFGAAFGVSPHAYRRTFGARTPPRPAHDDARPATPV